MGFVSLGGVRDSHCKERFTGLLRTRSVRARSDTSVPSVTPDVLPSLDQWRFLRYNGYFVGTEGFEDPSRQWRERGCRRAEPRVLLHLLHRLHLLHLSAGGATCAGWLSNYGQLSTLQWTQCGVLIPQPL